MRKTTSESGRDLCCQSGARKVRARLDVAALCLLVSMGCSDSSPQSAAKVVATPVDPATAGSIRVEVAYRGDPPPRKEISMRSAPQCVASHDGPVYDDALLVRDHHLRNAVVWIKQGLDTWVFAPSSSPVTIDQKGCLYEPRVAAAMVNQPVEFRNSDAEAHNVHGRPQIVSSWNFLMSRQGANRTLSFDKPEIAVPIGCDIHPWMAGAIAIVANPYFGVTQDDGLVALTNVPPGDYAIGVWHEKLGTKEQHVTLAARGTADVKFDFGS